MSYWGMLLFWNERYNTCPLWYWFITYTWRHTLETSTIVGVWVICEYELFGEEMFGAYNISRSRLFYSMWFRRILVIARLELGQGTSWTIVDLIRWIDELHSWSASPFRDLVVGSPMHNQPNHIRSTSAYWMCQM